MTPAAFIQATSMVVENVRLARDTYRLRLASPDLAERIRPGQFLMLRLPDRNDPLLGRAFALYDTVLDHAGQPVAVDLAYLVVGKMTGLMAKLSPGDPVDVWGPLGNGFPAYTGVEHLTLVAGGIGQTPFPALLKRVLGKQGYAGQPVGREVERVSFYWGVRTADYFGGLEAFEGAAVSLSTDDGSRGFKGFVTQLVERDLRLNPGRQPIAESRKPLHLVGCGPEPMMHALSEVASRCRASCDVSLETPMACGIGVCFSCVTRVRLDRQWDYRRVCVEGPVFDAARIVW